MGMRRLDGAPRRGVEDTAAGERLRCPLCDGGRFTLLFEEGHRLLLCRGCGLAFVDGAARDLDADYSRQYDPGLEDRPAVHERALRWVSRHLPAGGGLSLLE